jgi:cytochrome c oxidase assembly protein subunit 15
MTLIKPLPSRSLALWLFACCALIIAMVIIGAITRLTESGLSIVEWHAASDMLPPLSHGAWLEAFQKYQTSPQYKDINAGMSLGDFKAIYFWEWLHRLLGRLVGLVYALPLIVFWLRGKIPSALKPRFVFFLFLGGLQGAIGWYMVKSGLVNEPRVSHYRLALHLCTALLLLVLLWLQALQLSPRARQLAHNYSTVYLQKYKAHGVAALSIICITIIWGAFVAGLRAGMEYNEFPTMGGKLIPGELLFLHPWWLNFLNNHAAVQWLHRVLGTLSFLTVFSFGIHAYWSRNYLLRNCGIVLMALITLQFMLGVSTLLSRVAIPLAALHQSGAMATLLTVVTTLAFLFYKRDRA